MTNNVSYCISEYLKNDHRIELDEKLSFVLGSSLGLSLLPKGEFISIDPLLEDVSKYYISPINPLSLECFASTMNYMLYVDQHKDMGELHWLVDEIIRNSKKFLVTLSDKILDENQEYDRPIFGVVSLSEQPEPVSPEQVDYTTLKIKIEFTAQKYVEVTADHFLDFWIINGNELFNSNRFTLTPPTINPLHKNFNAQCRSALLRQFYGNQLQEAGSGIYLLKQLKNKLVSSRSVKEIEAHRALFLYSFGKEDLLHNSDMNRKHYATCLLSLGAEQPEKEKASESYFKAGNAWMNARQFLQLNANISSQEMLAVYDDLLAKEENAMVGLENFLKAWN